MREPRVIEKPGELPAWQDPAIRHWFLPCAGTLEVRLTARATRHVWDSYKTFKRMPKMPFILVNEAGDIGLIEPVWTAAEAAEWAMNRFWVAYNAQSRKCWRPVWKSLEIEQRTVNNFYHEPVLLFGWEGIIDGWHDRPKAKLFANVI